MAYVDPWGGFNQGVQAIGSALDTSAEQRKQEELMQIKRDELARAKETRQGLGSIFAQRGVTKQETEYAPNPELGAWNNAHSEEALKSAMSPQPADAGTAELENGLGLAPTQSSPQGESDLAMASQPRPSELLSKQTTVPMYSAGELQNQASQYLMGRGDWDGLKGLENAIDVTSKIDKRSMDMLNGMTKSIKDMRSSGLSTDSIKTILKQQANSLNRMNGTTVFDPKMVDTLNINAAGDLVTQDLGGGQLLVMVPQPNGMLTVQVVDRTKGDRVSNESRRLDQSGERIQQGWARLNPRLQAELEASKASGKVEATEIVKDKNNYYNAQDANMFLSQAEAILDKDPRQVAGVTAKFRAMIGSIDPALETALRSGDRKSFERLMITNAETFKKLLGPQISNTDATLMFQLSGATASSEAEIRTAIRSLRQKNDTAIRTFEDRQGRVGETAPATSPYTAAQPSQAKPPSQRPTTAPMSKEAIHATVKQEAASMKAGTSKKTTFNGRPGTITKDASGAVTVKID